MLNQVIDTLGDQPPETLRDYARLIMSDSAPAPISMVPKSTRQQVAVRLRMLADDPVLLKATLDQARNLDPSKMSNPLEAFEETDSDDSDKSGGKR